MQGDAERLEQALQRRGSIEAVEMPVQDFADRLSQQFGVPIDVDWKKLEEAGVNRNSPINKRLESIPLVSILERGLSDVELTFAIRDHVILITTPEEAESQLVTRIYPVRDLVYGPVSDGDYDSLIEVITTTISPQSWDEVGGPGSIGVFGNASSLVISQTDEIHRAVEPLLVKLRQVKKFQGISLRNPQPSENHQKVVPQAHRRPPRRRGSHATN
jgi:hypothetical protein